MNRAHPCLKDGRGHKCHKKREKEELGKRFVSKDEKQEREDHWSATPPLLSLMQRREVPPQPSADQDSVDRPDENHPLAVALQLRPKTLLPRPKKRVSSSQPDFIQPRARY